MVFEIALSIFVCMYLSIYLSIYVCVYISLCIYLSNNLCNNLSYCSYLSVNMFFCQSPHTLTLTDPHPPTHPPHPFTNPPTPHNTLRSKNVVPNGIPVMVKRDAKIAHIVSVVKVVIHSVFCVEEPCVQWLWTRASTHGVGASTDV